MKRLARLAIAALAALLLIPIFTTVAEAAPPGTPTATFPSPNANVTTNPVFTWNPPSPIGNTDRYRIQVSANNSFTDIRYDQTTPNTKATPTFELPLGPLFWRVQAINSNATGGESGSFTPTISFNKVAPNAPNATGPQESPALQYPSEPVTLTWDPVPGAASYDVEIAYDDQFTAPLFFTVNTKQVSYTVDQKFTFGQNYYWHVRAVNFANQPTQYSAVRHFSTTWNQIPQLIRPANTQLPAIENVVFEWGWVPGAGSYDIEIATDIGFTNIALTGTVQGTIFEPQQNLQNTSYFWHVRAKTPQNVVSNQWSETRTFERRWPGSPFPTPPAANSLITQLAPADNAVVNTPTFKWTPFRQADYYEIQLSLSPHFETGVHTSCITHHTEVTPANDCNLNITSGTEYYWRVRGVDQPGNILGLFTAPYVIVGGIGEYPSFHYQPNVPNQLSPANHTSTNRPVLKWSIVPNVGRYKVTVIRTSDQAVFPVETNFNEYVPNVPYDAVTPANNVYEWWVQSIDNNGAVSGIPDHPWRDFTLTAPGTGASPTPDAGTYTGDHIPTLLWSPVTNAAYYRVFYKPIANASYIMMTDQQRIPAYAYTLDQIGLGTYNWKIEAYDQNNVLLAAGTPSTFTLTSLPALTGQNGGPQQTAPSHCADAISCTTLRETPTFTWDSVPGAAFYQVILARDVNFTNVITTYQTIFNRFRPITSFPETQAGQATYWFVKPCTTGQRCSPGPELFPPPNYHPPISAFRKQSAPVTLLSPANNASLPNQITFKWEDYLTTQTTPPCTEAPIPVTVCPTQEARNYTLEIATLADFSDVQAFVVDQTEYTPNNLYGEGPLYWRVYARDAQGNALPVSATRVVNKVSPTMDLLSPAPNATVDKLPTFRWTPRDYTAKYEIEVYKNTNQPLAGANRVIGNVQTAQTAYSPTEALPPGLYGWRMRPIDINGRPGPWTADTNTGLRKFTSNGLTTTLTAPNDNAQFGPNDANLLFTWQPVAGAAYYIFQSSTSNQFTSTQDNINTPMTAWAPTTTYPQGTYFWRVQTFDAQNNLLGTSVVRKFIKGLTTPTEPLNPTAVAGDSKATVSWSAPASNGGSNITGYLVNASGGANQTCSWSSGPLTCVVNGLVNGTSYTFTVKAINAQGTGPASVASNAVTPNGAPSAPTNVQAVAGSGQATVTWTAPANTGGNPITSYTIASVPGGQTCTWTTGPLTCTVNGLTNGTLYTFTVKATTTAGTGAAGTSNGVTPTSADWFHSLSPVRIQDSRPAFQAGAYSTPWGGNVTRDVQVTNVGGVPASADAVVLNVTATGTTASGFLTIYPKGATKPGASSLNWNAGQTVANAVTVKVGTGGNISVFNPGGNVDVIADVVGYYDTNTGDGFTSLSPVRIQDSRPAFQEGPYSTPWGGNVTRDVQVTTVGGVPANASAVVLNATAVNATGSGFLTIWPAGESKPLVSSLNFNAGQTVANAVTVKVGSGGNVSVYNPGGNVDVIFDVVGYFTPGTGQLFHPISPQRLQDSRPAFQVGPYSTPWGADVTRDVQASNVFGIPLGIDSVLLNVTVTGPTAPGFLTIWPKGQTKPLASSVNFNAGQTVANAVTVKAGTGGNISVFNPGGSVDVIADAAGYYSS